MNVTARNARNHSVALPNQATAQQWCCDCVMHQATSCTCIDDGLMMLHQNTGRKRVSFHRVAGIDLDPAGMGSPPRSTMVTPFAVSKIQMGVFIHSFSCFPSENSCQNSSENTAEMTFEVIEAK